MKFRGQELSPLHTIARRVIMFPFAQLFRILFCLCILLGWGFNTARRAWLDTQ